MSLTDDFVATVKGTESPRQLAEALTKFVEDACPGVKAACFLEEDEGYVAVASPGRDLSKIVLPLQGITRDLVGTTRAPIDLCSLIAERGGPGQAEERNLFAQLEASMLIPIVSGVEPIGFLSIGGSPRCTPIKSDAAGLTALGRIAGFLLQLSKYRTQVEEDMRAAGEIQRRFLPQERPSVACIDYSAVFLPARAVSGDYYDFVRFSDGRFAFAVGDVAGKGIAAALIMANVKTSLRKAMLSKEDRLTELMNEMHSIVYEAAPRTRFATLFYGFYHPQTLQLRYVSAGHAPPAILVRDGQTTLLTIGGSVLGLLEAPKVGHRIGRVNLQKHDVIVVATDGVSEALNGQGAFWGDDSFIEAVLDACSRGGSSDDIVRNIVNDLESFVSGAPQSDDITVLALKVVPPK